MDFDRPIIEETITLMNQPNQADLAREQRLRRYSGSQSVTRQHVSPTRNRENHTEKSLSSSPSPGYVLEWPSGPSHAPQHRHILSSVEELRSEILAGEPSHGQGRSLVLRTAHINEEVRGTLQNVAGLDEGFITAHVEGKPYRPRLGGARPRWWCWKYPEVAAGMGQTQYRPDHGQILTMARASLWMGSGIPILLIGENNVAEPKTNARRGGTKAPKLKHQDADTAMSQFASAVGPPYGSFGSAFNNPAAPKRLEMSSFEEDLWETLVAQGIRGGRKNDVPLEELFGELIYDRWIDCLSAMRLETNNFEQEQNSLWRAMSSLEINLDDAKYLSRRGKQLDVVSPLAWNDLIQRLQMRIHLRQPAVHAEWQLAALARTQPETDNDRSLDRVAYLGGLLLPITVVASILAIEGDYGPEGNNFWVFWLSSFVASMVAILIIYADQLRSAEVWLEIGEDFDDEEDPEERRGLSTRYLVQRWADGTKGSTWKRAQLGWGGAVKKMSGYYRWRRDPRLAFRRPGEIVRSKFV